MAVVSPVPDATTQQASPLTLAGDMESGREIVAEPVARNSGGKRICIVHVHQPSQTIPLMGTKFLASALKEQEVRAYREIERQEMHRMLDEYFLLCRQMGVRAEKLYVEMESIEKGILELISQHGIRKLVMGAAADKRYSKNMMGIKSKKAISVFQQAPASCHIWFICKGQLIHTREGALDGTEPLCETHQSSSRYFFQRLRTMKVDGRGGRLSISASSDGGPSTPSSRSDADGSSDEYDVVSRRSASQNSVLSPCSSSGMVNAALVPLVGTEGSNTGLELSILPHKEDLCQSSPPSVLDGSTEDPLFDQLERAMSDAENSRCEAFKEAARRAKAEKDAFEAMRKARASENLYTEESKRRKRS
ncbi:PROTEIN KINASE putative-RELATED [Salix viminalis]|uniref:RING-type E3 ubiquitin transferase n=1 Tax=Salix viminalis TaxID=40686 RepID=A0A9Q0UGK3_SALVM|nr:PROTEIN KINASE putative-RELATED [Salix viminalis]